MNFEDIKPGTKVYWNSIILKCGKKLSNGKQYEILKVFEKTTKENRGNITIQILDDDNKLLTTELFNFISIEKFNESSGGRFFRELTQKAGT